MNTPENFDEVHVVILGSGDATRLRPITMGWPKPLVTICGVSVLEHQITQLMAAGIRSATLSIQIPSALVADALASATPVGFSLHTFVRASSSPLSQVEAVKCAIPGDCKTVLVIYGDSLLSVDFGMLLRRHREFVDSGAAATVLVHHPKDLFSPNADGRTYHGVMAVDDDIVTRFVEKPNVKEIDWENPVANAAVFALQEEFLRSERFAAASNFSFDIFELAVKALPGSIRAVPIGLGYRHDVGSIARLYDLNIQTLRGDFPFPIPGKQSSAGCYFGDGVSHGNVAVEQPVFVDSHCRIGNNVRLGPNTIVGKGVTIDDGVKISESVILENTQIGEGTTIDRSFIGQSCRITRKSIVPPHTVLGSFCVLGGTDWPT